MAYQTLDYLPDLTIAKRTVAINAPMQTLSANSGSWDVGFTVVRTDANALLSDTYKVSLVEGVSYYVSSSSYFDPFIVIVYDEDGNAIKTSEEATYGTDTANFFAPYTGFYYVSAGWDQGNFYTTVSLGIYADLNVANFAGNDTLTGSNVLAKAGNDHVTGTAGADFLRGEDGDDLLNGGDGFDDMHGNQGSDTLNGGGGGDWVVGGKGDDTLKGDDGDDVVLGNIGKDTLEGGLGVDWVRGGQDDDVLYGGSGNDWMSGDRGSDTITGGSGADTFNFFAGAGTDRVTDFSYNDGDRIHLELGTQYSAAQVGADIVITVTDGQMVLVGVQLSSLAGDWLVVS